MSPIKTFAGILSIVLVLVLFSCLYTVTEGNEAMVLRFGKVGTDSAGNPIVSQPGLHVKLPIIDRVYPFDIRLQTLDVQSSRFLTEQQKNVIVDYYAMWRVSNVPLFYRRTGGDNTRAETLLTQQLNDGLRAEFGRRTLSEVVSDDRATIMKALSKQANVSAKNLGIEVVDVRVKRIDLPENVSNSVYDRMRVEREKAATQYRSEGKAQAEEIRANADAEATITVATARANDNKIRAEGDAKAADIYASAYNKDRGFYAFYRSLQAYVDTFNQKSDVLLLTPDAQFFTYFNNAKGSTAPKHHQAPAQQ